MCRRWLFLVTTSYAELVAFNGFTASSEVVNDVQNYEASMVQQALDGIRRQGKRGRFRSVALMKVAISAAMALAFVLMSCSKVLGTGHNLSSGTRRLAGEEDIEKSINQTCQAGPDVRYKRLWGCKFGRPFGSRGWNMFDYASGAIACCSVQSHGNFPYYRAWCPRNALSAIPLFGSLSIAE